MPRLEKVENPSKNLEGREEMPRKIAKVVVKETHVLGHCITEGKGEKIEAGTVVKVFETPQQAEGFLENRLHGNLCYKCGGWMLIELPDPRRCEIIEEEERLVSKKFTFSDMDEINRYRNPISEYLERELRTGFTASVGREAFSINYSVGGEGAGLTPPWHSTGSGSSSYMTGDQIFRGLLPKDVQDWLSTFFDLRRFPHMWKEIPLPFSFELFIPDWLLKENQSDFELRNTRK